MKTLILARHGKAEKAEIGTYDFKRKLVERGKLDVNQVSEKIKNIIIPEIIVSSPAERAFQTAKIFAKSFQLEKQSIILQDSIYEANMGSLLKIINELNDDYKVVLMTGHNPAFEFAIEYLTNTQIGHLATSTSGIIIFDTNEWKSVSNGTGTLKTIINP